VGSLWLSFHLMTKGSEKNQYIRQKTGTQNIVKEIKQYQEKWLKHVQRMDTDRLPKQALQYKPKGRRNIGRPRKKWRNQLHLEDQGTGNMPNPSGTWWWWWWWNSEPLAEEGTWNFWNLQNLTLILLMWRIWWAPNYASKWQMGFNLPFKVLSVQHVFVH